MLRCAGFAAFAIISQLIVSLSAYAGQSHIENERLASKLFSQARLAAMAGGKGANGCSLDASRSLGEAVEMLAKGATGSVVQHTRIPRQDDAYHSIVIRTESGLLSVGVTERDERCATYLVSVVVVN